MAIAELWELRAGFAKRLSALYGQEVPAYASLVEVSHAVNRDVLAARGSRAERLGSIARVSAERHGAIRVGTPTELAQVARIFAAMGMYPVGFYDLREASASAVPVVSTAFRPIDADELARNPFRVFTSMLVTSDRRFFNKDLQGRLENFLRARTLFAPELLRLADRAADDGGLPHADAERFLGLATAAFKLSPEPVDRAWYQELEAVSSVAADIGGVTRTHINHLTPRVLDIDALYHRMGARGIAMIDAIQGPPRWEGPDLLLRQTSFRALAEPRNFREADGRVVTGDLRVRFGEVEARGIAATPSGRALYDELTVDTERALNATAAETLGAEARNSVAADLWRRRLPLTEAEIAAKDLAYFTFRVNATRPPQGDAPTADLRQLIENGWVVAEPQVYEDFLPKSAAGIFQSNLTSDGGRDSSQVATEIDAGWLGGVLGTHLYDPHDLYSHIRRRSLAKVASALGVHPDIHIHPLRPSTEGQPA